MQTLTSQTNYNPADEQPAMVCWCRFLYIIKHLKIFYNKFDKIRQIILLMYFTLNLTLLKYHHKYYLLLKVHYAF